MFSSIHWDKIIKSLAECNDAHKFRSSFRLSATSPDPPKMTRDNLYRKATRNVKKVCNQSSISQDEDEEIIHDQSTGTLVIRCSPLNSNQPPVVQHLRLQRVHPEESSSGASSLTSLASSSSDQDQKSPTNGEVDENNLGDSKVNGQWEQDSDTLKAHHTR